MRMIKNYCNFCGNETTNQKPTTDRIYSYDIFVTGPLGTIKGHMIDICFDCSTEIVNCLKHLKDKGNAKK